MLKVIHEILAHHRQLESKWHTKKIKLHQRLALRLFQEDVKQVGNNILYEMLSQSTRTDYPFSTISPTVQVLDWLEKHGEVFLRKNVGIGRNLAKSRAYQKSHETFEGVVQVGNFTLSPLGSLENTKLSFEQKHISIDASVFVFVFV